MGYQSDPSFRTFHALRIKGFAKADVVAEVSGVPEDQVVEHLQALLAAGNAAFREARGLWQLTAPGREAHAAQLAADVEASGMGDGLKADYEHFLHLNEAFKALCGDWQLRNGDPNDHSDAAYDAEVIGRLAALDDEAQPILVRMGGVLERLSGYPGRLSIALAALRGGATNMFTGVMCNSYHDIWMELHEDLILTQGIDRAAEGSF